MAGKSKKSASARTCLDAANATAATNELRAIDKLNQAVANAEAVVGALRHGLEPSMQGDDLPPYDSTDLHGCLTVVLENLNAAKEAREILDEARKMRI